MIISASRRTDIPAFYADWFMQRIRHGHCLVPNPFNTRQIAHVSLKPDEVDVIVFWTRNPRPLLPYLPELDGRGYRYYFQYTILNYPHSIDQKTPSLESAIETFQDLAGMCGPERIIWRYDPLLFTTITPAEFHLLAYTVIAQRLAGSTGRSVISIADDYPKARKRLSQLEGQGIRLVQANLTSHTWFGELLQLLAQVARQHGMQITSCAEELDLRPYGIQPGRCIDHEYIRDTFGLEVTSRKDPAQRKDCGCVISKDIGMYQSCLYGCQYCYANADFEGSRHNYERHDPASTRLLP
jgi:hypothetical protein